MINEDKFMKYFNESGYIAFLDNEEHSIEGIMERFIDEKEDE